MATRNNLQNQLPSSVAAATNTLPAASATRLAAGGALQTFAFGRTFKRFDLSNDVLSSVREITTDTVWDDPDGYLTTFFTSSTELTYSSSNYYYNIYQNATEAASGSDVHFSIAYGHSEGLGSVTGSAALYTGNLTGSRTPSRAIYSQYKNILLQPTDELFTFGVAESNIPNTSSKDIWVINFSRHRYKEKLDPGNWELKLKNSTTAITLIDNSGQNGVTPTIGNSGRVFNVVSGSITAGTASSTRAYGLVYPDVGIIVLHPGALELASVVSGYSTASYVAPASSNNRVLYNSISSGSSFQARTEENISSTYYFVRVGHNEFNYTTNPTFTTGSLGLIRYSLFHTDPRVYITSVGLYDDNNNLLAVAKLSKPLLKSFTRECLIRVRIDF